MLRKPYSPEFSDYTVHMVVNRTVDEAKSLSVMMTTNFVPTSNVFTLSNQSYVYTCDFDVDGTCFELSTPVKSWSNSQFFIRSVVPQGTNALVWEETSSVTVLKGFPLDEGNSFPGKDGMSISFWMAWMTSPVTPATSILNISSEAKGEYLRISSGTADQIL